ncbi:hypothetical protein CEXT_574221 [Caerostris extrusa]|uniref:Uncharacterized protein n=1 Tax=Caerostris extrusa TaxID=172846 RepID=A0AAV4P8I5_CAEEX|nr:hypothetical protein CEXT_574221 [Caerostris extrusa]
MSTAIALKKNFCCRKKLDGVIMRMVSGGLFQKLVNDKLFETRVQMRSSEVEGSEEKVIGSRRCIWNLSFLDCFLCGFFCFAGW